MELALKLYGGVRYIDAPCPVNVRRLDHNALPLIHRMHQNGIRVDVPFLQSLEKKIAAKKSDIEYDLFQSIGVDYRDSVAGFHSPFNIGSPDMVARLLFDHLQVHKGTQLKMTKMGKRPTTEDQVLELIRDVHPAVNYVLDWREMDKLESTYVLPLQIVALRDPDRRIHTTFSATTAATGRLSSSNPNLQNIPIKSELGKEVRKAFLAGNGRVLVSNDLSQIEMRWAAHRSKDPAMMEVFNLELDIHDRTACAIFHRNLALVTEVKKKVKLGVASEAEEKFYKHFVQFERLPSKNLGFGVLYGETPQGLMIHIQQYKDPTWTPVERKEFMDAWVLESCEKLVVQWFEEYSFIKQMMEEEFRRVRRWGMCWDAFGRVRLVPEVYSAHKRIRAEGERKAGNHCIQSSAQGTIKLAMAEVLPVADMFNSGGGCVCWPLLQIHDELIHELDRGQAKDFAECTSEIMEKATPLVIPVRSSSDIAERWGDLK